ncbi:MAG: serine hydrolase [Gemmatimonadetes bacterium]|nr:serine hydrolase [Gemmatimonadota bacterium]
MVAYAAIALGGSAGSRWSYSGEGFFFLQRVLERITGQGIGTIVRERVLTPLGMARSASPDAHRPTARPSRGGGTRVDDARPALRTCPRDHPVSLVPNAAASLMTTANDFARPAAAGGGAHPPREMTPQGGRTIGGAGHRPGTHGTSRAAWRWGGQPGTGSSPTAPGVRG